MPSDILLLVSTPMECSDIRRQIEDSHEASISGKTHITGRLETLQITLVITGLGAVNAAHAATCALERFRPKLVLQFGVGGAYLTSGLDVGDIAVATEEVYGDLGVITPDGWASAELIGIPVLDKEEDSYFNSFPLNENLASSAVDLAHQVAWNDDPPNIKKGVFVTVQQCSGVTAVGNEIADRFNGICENMEGAAVAHLCTMYDVPFLEIRAISNRVEDRNMADWNLPLSVKRIQQTVHHVIKSLRL